MMRGFSLLELLVAVACTAMLSAAVLSLLVGSAATSRREWGRLEARHVANAAAAAVIRDLEGAGIGLEQAGAVQLDGERIGIAEPLAAGGLRVVLALDTAVEIAGHAPGSRYTLVGGAFLAVGDRIAAVGAPALPAATPLPLGVITSATSVAGVRHVQVAWRPAEAALVAASGEPRALLPVLVREYEVRAADGALQLVRRNDGGARQPVADLLDAFTVAWLLDTDGDGDADVLHDGPFPAAARPCAARVEVTVVPALAREGPAPVAGNAERATRWAALGAC